MRILQIMASSALGGAETYSTDVMLSLHKAKIDQCVVMAADAPRFAEMKAAGLRMVSWPLSVPLLSVQKILMKILIAREKPDIVQSWMRRGAALAGKGSAFSIQHSKKKVPSPNAECRPLPPVFIGWFGGYYDTDKFKNCAHLVGVTKDIVAHMVKHGTAVDRAHFIPTFPDVAAMPPIDRATLATPRNAKVLLALSRLHPKKGLDTLLEALSRLPPEVMVWLAGDGHLRRELETLAKKLGVIDRVRFLGWRTDRAALLRAADICVLPSRYEPFGTVILEAWAAGTPLVACASAGPAATVEDGVSGLITPIDDVGALADAVKRALTDEELRRRLVAQGYAAYIKDYTREAVTHQWLRFYKSLLN